RRAGARGRERSRQRERAGQSASGDRGRLCRDRRLRLFAVAAGERGARADGAEQSEPLSARNVYVAIGFVHGASLRNFGSRPQLPDGVPPTNAALKPTSRRRNKFFNAVLTVFSEMPNAVPISALVNPAATNSTICRSLDVKDVSIAL